MELPILIEPLADQQGFSAHLGAPFNLTAVAATAEEARRHVAGLLQNQFKLGAQLGSINVPVGSAAGVGGWLPDDELTREWLELVLAYREECDASDRQRLLDDSGKAAS